MIRNETEYQEALKRIAEEKARLAQYVANWNSKGYGPDEVAAAQVAMKNPHPGLKRSLLEIPAVAMTKALAVSVNDMIQKVRVAQAGFRRIRNL